MLTVELFEQIATALKADRGSARDQRGGPRVGLRTRAKISPMLLGDKGAQPVDVWVRDLSMNGIGLTASHALPQGSTFSITLPTKAGEKIVLTYKVAHCTQASSTVFVIGASLEQSIEDVTKASRPAPRQAQRRSA